MAAEIRAATAITAPSLLNGSKNLLAQELIKKMLSLKEAATTAATSGR